MGTIKGASSIVERLLSFKNKTRNVYRLYQQKTLENMAITAYYGPLAVINGCPTKSSANHPYRIHLRYSAFAAAST